MAQDDPGSFAGTTGGKDSQLAGTSHRKPQPRKHNVLLADDDASIRESLRKLLLLEGYQVVMAVNGVEAVEKSRSVQNPIDLVLLDLNMPLKNGWATLDRLLEANPRLPVLLLTGLPNQYPLAEAAGIRALVEKPIDVPGLLQLVQELLAGPVQSTRQSTGREVLPIHHLRASGRSSQDRWPEQHVTPYASGGLNE